MKKIRLLHIENNHLLRKEILAILKPYKDIVVNAISDENESALIKIQQLKPNVILMGLALRGWSSLQVVEIVKKEISEAKIIVMDFVPIQADLLQFIKSGANGFILKDASPKEFLFTIRSVANGTTVLPSLLVKSLFSQIVDNVAIKSNPVIKETVLMTKREREIITLLSDGMSNKEIGDELTISTFTVKSHIHNIMEKLALHTRLAIANYSYENKTINTVTNSISLYNN